LLFCLLFVGKRTPEEDKFVGNEFAQHAVQPGGWRAGGPAYNGQASDRRRNLMRRHGVFLLSAVQEKQRDAARHGRCAPRRINLQLQHKSLL
ncbi:hypothetical protein, partial [Raoultella scottii]|uniref:hypothetical protein n=1 Tax=Raoultella scottii TaxID=3040937 RepID=UPI002FBA5F49